MNRVVDVTSTCAGENLAVPSDEKTRSVPISAKPNLDAFIHGPLRVAGGDVTPDEVRLIGGVEGARGLGNVLRHT